MTATPGVGVVATLTQEWERLLHEFEHLLLQQDTSTTTATTPHNTAASSFWLPRETVYPTVMVVVAGTAVPLTVTYYYVYRQPRHIRTNYHQNQLSIHESFV